MSERAQILSLDGGLFTVVSDGRAYRHNGTVSGAWTDGPHGFMHFYSGPRDHAELTLRYVMAGRPKSHYTLSEGTLEVGTIVNYRTTDMAVIGEFGYALYQGSHHSFWGTGGTSAEGMADFVDSIAIVDRPGEGIALKPRAKNDFRFVGEGSMATLSLRDSSILELFSLTPDEKARIPTSAGLRTEAGIVTRSNEDPPRLRVVNDRARLELRLSDSADKQAATDRVLALTEVDFRAEAV